MAETIRAIIDRFVAGFNDNDLDGVMAHFAADAVYQADERHEGKAAIRGAFEPQFRGAWGKMRFDVHDVVVDEGARKATIRWTCRHDASGDHGRAMSLPLKLFARVAYRGRMGWEGVDVLHFDEAGTITGKFSYTNGRPALSRELGVPL